MACFSSSRPLPLLAWIGTTGTPSCWPSCVGVDADALALGHVDHVQGDDDRHAQLQDLRGQVEVALEVGGIDDGDDDVGPRLAGLLAEDDVDRDHLVGAARRQAVGAGQVDEVERPGRRGSCWPFFVSTVTPG